MATTSVDQVTGYGETLALKAPCRLATTANIVLSGLQTIDGVATAANDRVLVRIQDAPAQNGIYIAASGAWRRARDMDSNRDLTRGTRVYVTEGDSGPAEFEVTTESPITVGSSSIAFDLSAGSVNAAALSAAAAVAVGAMTTVIDPQFSTLAIAQAYSPTVAPTYIRTAFYDTNQVAGSGGVYKNNGTTTGDLVIVLSGSGTLVGYTLTGTPNASQKGARKNNTNDDGPATQAAHDLGVGGVEFLAGTHKMVPTGTSTFTLGNQPNNIYRSVALTADNVTFSGDDAVLRGVSRPGVIADDVQPIFSTNKNLTQGTRKNIKFKGLKFDSNNDGDVANSNQRFGYFVGVDGLKFEDTEAGSSGARRGYFAHIQNSRDVQINAHYHHKMTGGFNVRYCENFVLTNFVFKDFSEAIDLDGTSKRVIIRNGVFEGIARTAQCIDINDQVDASIGDFSVYLVGNIATINYKTTTPDTYSEYVANSLVRNFQLSKRIILSNITGSAIGDGVLPSYYIGWDWSAGNHAGAGPVSEITLENINHDDVSFISVLECQDLVLRNITLQRALSSVGYAAVDLRSSAATADQLGWSGLDVQIDKMRIENAQRGAVKISVASRAVVHGLITKGNNTLGGADADLIVTSMHSRACRGDVDNCDIEGNVTLNGDSTSITAWAANTFYKKNSIRTNGGNFYRSVAEGYSAAATGPTSTTSLAELDDGSALAATWAGSTAYVVDDVVKNGAAYYICMVAGTSAASGGPTGSDMRILDGTTLVWRPISGFVTWEYLPTPYSVRWGKNNRVRGTVTLQGDAQKYIYGESASAEVGDLAATGVVNKSVFVARRRTLVTRVSYQTTASVVADPTNYRTLLIRRYRAGVPTTVSTIDTTTTGFTASVFLDGGVTASPAGAYMEPGDVLQLTSNVGGTGVAITGLGFTVDFIEY
ncbi:hypothetical protein L2449_16825 [Mesorhizobium muleiense]|uniref:hypothetical protein n=1 Tax=Mesorhizobium muleiense TaxID=1004279 RepID=UPI001F35EF4B|nr:hypothetical protein [Mesorhizobium muleiense]MCF6118543.1 hypothetical protein [Mesorhizobium muleiense]